MPPCAAVLAEARRVACAYLRRKARCLRLSPLQRCDSSNQKREAGREKGTEGHLVRKDPGMLAPSYVVPHAQRLPPHHQNTHTHTHTRTYTIVSETERGWEGLKIKCMCRRQRVAMRHSACLHMYCAARRGAHVVRQRHMAPSALQWGLKPSAAQRVYRGLQWGLQGAYNEVYSPQRRAHGVYTPRAFHHMPQASG
jgi:hypothetical protein